MKLLVFCVALAPASALAEEAFTSWSTGKSSAVGVEHLAMPLSDEEFYADRYTIEAWFEDGTHAYVSVLVSNLGPGDGKMTAKGRWYEKDGKEHYFKKELDKGEYKQTASPFSLEAGPVRLAGTPRAFKVHAAQGEYTFDLSFASGLAPWRPGSGRATFGGDDKYLDVTLVQPKAVVTGSVSHGGAKTDVKGYGYVIHTVSTAAPYLMFKRHLSVMSLKGDTVTWLYNYATPGGKTFGFLYVARGGKALLATTGAPLKPGDFHTDSKHANKYKVPFELGATVKRPERTIDVKVVATKISGREDELEGRSAVEKALMQQFAQPVNYNLDAKVTVTITEGTAEPVVTEEACDYELVHMNK